MKLNLDPWQKEILSTDGNILLISGRRIGKSEILSMDAAEYAVNNKEKSILVISHTERQAYWLFEKITGYILDNYPKALKRGKDKPTKTQAKLNNGSIIRCLPTGLSGSGIRGIHADRIYPDECDYIDEGVWNAITPMLLTGKNTCIRGGTTPNPSKEKGYVYKSMFKNPSFKVFNISTEEVIQKRAISDTWTIEQRENALRHLESEKRNMSKLAYAVEYLGQWVDNLKRFFPQELIDKCCTLQRGTIFVGKKYLGVDLARMGDDKSSFQIVNKIDKKFYHTESLVTAKKYTTESFDKIIELNNIHNFEAIGVDAGAGTLGVGLLDFLMRESAIKHKLIALNNRARALDYEGEKKTTLQKEDMYQNLLAMMEHGVIKLLDDDEVKLSLQSVQYDIEITPQEKTLNKIFSHVNSDIVEALIRAAYLANESKSLNLWAAWSNNGRIRTSY